MRTAVQPKSRPRPVRFRGRSYMAFALAPELPIADWLADIDGAIARSPGFFSGRPAVLDLAGLTLPTAEILSLIKALEERGIRIMGLEGGDADYGPELPPVLTSGRPTASADAGPAEPEPPRSAEVTRLVPAAAPPSAASLTIDVPVRSGQTIYHPHGDVIVLGAVSSGAEVVAGGSIHIYGTLRGRAMAGAGGDRRARIFCRRIEAELLAISGYYRTVDDLEASLRSRPIQAWLEGETMLIAALD
ncbi:septum site-determining protein MinC [Rhodoplanes sp. TEM]|uniref:Probable septum site-determining protein MinC n=1 Tax=Rhodoplanes tepidamans TaxID=200616 RepID=A0ABT5J4Y2_RHOTP|nr:MULTISPECIES: septum site-determining protein MinC [Rhodoplanes]MDC7784677.1 septum site-determining protein MinC [Rhodoplanes tepidamans]MDC7982144.1 septum site-determining protein MinC [Rhodoplanes sp. TEM]MDQ0356148.1 septum site-determining protein MinC [Rhodoplanes tepidamans]